jgi:hypothetical protein
MNLELALPLVGTLLVSFFGGAITVYISQQAHIRRIKERVSDKRMDAYRDAVMFLNTLLDRIVSDKNPDISDAERASRLNAMRSEFKAIKMYMILYAQDDTLRQFNKTHQAMSKAKSSDDHQKKLNWSEKLLREISNTTLAIRAELIETKINSEEMFLEILGHGDDPNLLANRLKADGK